MQKTQVNPWTWHEGAGFSQAWSVSGAERIIFVSGQAPISSEGELVGKADFEVQTTQVFENLRTVLEQAGAGFDAVVKFTVYLTDVSRVRDFSRIKADYIEGPQPASTVIGVTGLPLPGMMIEVEAMAVT